MAGTADALNNEIRRLQKELGISNFPDQRDVIPNKPVTRRGAAKP